MDKRRRLVLVSILVSSVAGCTSHAALPSGAICVPTDDTLVSFTSLGILCMGSATVPVHLPLGVLDGDPSDPVSPAWLRADDGSRRYVVWPRDFSVRFDPDATLLDETGAPILHAGSPVILSDLTTDPTPGTKDRPYLAETFETGLIRFPHCYTHDH